MLRGFLSFDGIVKTGILERPFTDKEKCLFHSKSMFRLQYFCSEKRSAMKLTHLLIIAMLSLPLKAQNYSVATNAAELANLGTLNTELGVGLSRNISITAQARYNPWHYGQGRDTFQNRQMTCSVGARYWPWHIYSSWFLGTKLQYSQYSVGGFSGPLTSEGDAYGIGAYAGWAWMLGKCLNLEFGAGLWGGYEQYVQYACPTCGRVVSSGNRPFLRINDILVQLAYVF